MRLPACQSLSLWERWHGVSRDGEGKPVSREPPCSDGQALCQSDTIAVSELSGSILALSVSLSLASSPKGGAFFSLSPKTCVNRPKNCVNGGCIGGGGVV